MKTIKSLLLVAAAMFTTASYAQVDSPFSFVDKDGKEVKSGTVMTVNTIEEDPISGEDMIPTGLYVKNNTNEKQGVGAFFNIKKMDNGSFQICFPQLCLSGINVCGMDRTKGGTMNAGQVKSLKAEWFPKADGVCEVEFKLEYYTINKGFGGMESLERMEEEDLDFPMPSVTVNFVKGATAINGIKDGENVEVTGIYDATGKQMQTTQKGLNIVKLSNGKTVKIVK